MTKLAYVQITDKEINEVKKVYYQLEFNERMYEAHQVMRDVLSLEEVKKVIYRYDLEEEVYLSLKHLGDTCKNKAELEESLIYMNLLLSDHYLPKQIYFKKLASLILSNQNFGIIIEDYCLLRHMMSFEEIETWFLNQKNYNIYRLLDIYLLEQRFDRLEPYIDLLKGHEMMIPYQEAIRYYSTSLYKKLFVSKKNFRFNLVWRTS